MNQKNIKNQCFLNIFCQKFDFFPALIYSAACFEQATTSRSSCKQCTCLGQINQGEMRVGVPMFAAGRTTTGWFHPNCFIQGVSVEISEKGNGGKCKLTNLKFAKGDFRCLIRSGNAKFGLGMKAAKMLLPPVLELAKMKMSEVEGVSTLPIEFQKMWNSSAASTTANNGVVSSPKKSTGAVTKTPKKLAVNGSAVKSVKKSGMKTRN